MVYGWNGAIQMSNVDKQIDIHTAAIANGRIVQNLLAQGAILIDGQARATAAGLLPPAPPVDEHAPKPVVDAQTLDAHEHPYDRMARETKTRFPHCHQEIDTFFKVERLRNEQENKEPSQIGDAVSRGSARSLQWAYFWEGIKKLELERHNEENYIKKMAKKKKKGKLNYKPRKGFNGPTYEVRRS